MLYTLNALSTLQDNANIVLTQQHYTLFDSRYFKSNKSIEDTFNLIYYGFTLNWTKIIKPFLDSIIQNKDTYKVKSVNQVVLIPEEGIYLDLQGLDASNIEYFYSNRNVNDDGFRLIGIKSDKEETKNYSFSMFDSPVYDPIHESFYNPITIVFYTHNFRLNKDDLNDILLRLVNYIILNYMDNKLSNKYGVVLNRILVNATEAANKDAIILPESLNISDTRFIFSYFYTLFRCLNSVLNTDILSSFLDYSSVIALPDLFNFNMTDEEATQAEEKMSTMTREEANLYAMGFKQKIYSRIWDLACKYKYSTGSNDIPNNTYIEICSDIMRNIVVNIDRDAYEAEQEYYEQFGSNEEDEESSDESN